MTNDDRIVREYVGGPMDGERHPVKLRCTSVGHPEARGWDIYLHTYYLGDDGRMYYEQGNVRTIGQAGEKP